MVPRGSAVASPPQVQPAVHNSGDTTICILTHNIYIWLYSDTWFLGKSEKTVFYGWEFLYDFIPWSFSHQM